MPAPASMTDDADLGALALGQVDAGLIVETARAVLAAPTPSGTEGDAADRLVAWGRTAAPELHWDCQNVGAGRANLVAWTGPDDWRESRGVWLYAHLDHSLSGRPADDLPLTGWAADPTDVVVTDDLVRGLGVAVARGPAVAAFAAARALARTARDIQVGVLLAAGGTHRHPAPTPLAAADPAGLATGLGLGVDAALGTGWRPAAVLNVKGGAAGVLSAEPGFLMVQVRWRSPFIALPARGDAPGAAVVAGHLAVAVEAWRTHYRAGVAGGRTAGGQLGADLCVGAVNSGLRYKPDLQPGHATLEIYLSTLEGQDVEQTVALLEQHLRDHLRDAAVDVPHGALSVRAYAHHPAAVTDEAEPVVTAARRAWEGDGHPSQVADYRGSTDGNLFRAAGIPTVRFGPTARPCDDDPTTEELPVPELILAARRYVRTIMDVSTPPVPPDEGEPR